jgi:hypothetical protein
MLPEPNVSRNSSYLVPCVFKAVYIIEALREIRTGLSVENLRGMTGYSRTTIYRILRTLVACGYVRRDSGGSYRLNYPVVPTVGKISRIDEDATHLNRPKVRFERSGVRFRENGEKRDAHFTTMRVSAFRGGAH